MQIQYIIRKSVFGETGSSTAGTNTLFPFVGGKLLWSIYSHYLFRKAKSR